MKKLSLFLLVASFLSAPLLDARFSKKSEEAEEEGTEKECRRCGSCCKKKKTSRRKNDKALETAR